MVGEVGPGKTVMVAMTAEKEVVAEPARILECDPPERFVVELGDPDAPWHLSVNLAEADGVTTMVSSTPWPRRGRHRCRTRLGVLRRPPDGFARRQEMPDWDADGYQAALAPHDAT